ncbi:MAG: hypothetical protein ABWY00_18420 [Dongiaceae bacterium]
MTQQSTASAAPRFTPQYISVTIDQKPFEVVNMNVFDVLIAGASDWIAPKQKIDFCFVLTLKGKEFILPTYGVVLKNDDHGLEIRYRSPSTRWRDILVQALTVESGRG